jgi:hypothetical protein
MLQPDRLAYCFSLTHELPDVEFKGPGKGRDNPLFGRVVRAAMVMANRRGGGIVIIGVAEEQIGLNFIGLTPEELETWKYESIAGGFNSYTNVPIEFDRLVHEHDGKTYLVLDIHEFASVPVMCVKEYRDRSNPKMTDDQCKIILRPGAFYIRTLNKPESKEMLTSEEIRTLFELAIDKGVQSFVTHTKLAGINIAPPPEDKELFARQVEGWNGPLLTEIRSRGYWDIHIRPIIFQRERLPLSQLYQLLRRAAVTYRGWEFPSVTPRTPETGLDLIGLEDQMQNELQAWRFFQSGQFAAKAGFLNDWGDKLTYRFQGDGAHTELLSTLEVVFRLTEVYGLASHLATTDIYRDEQSVVIDLTLCNVLNRRLFDRGTSGAIPLGGYTAKVNDIPRTFTLAKEDIIGRPQELAREAAHYIFERFGWSPSDQLLTTIQSELQIHS